MFMRYTKKISVIGFYLTLFSLLLMTLSGCDATSDPREYYQATGSWEGRVDNNSVRGVIDPDGSYHFTIVDTNGAILPDAGEYVGGNISIDPFNIGSMTLMRIQPEDVSAQRHVDFKLSADRFYSTDRLFNSGKPTIDLRRTNAAVGPADQSDIVGRWSFSAEDNFTDIVVNSQGTFSGGDGLQCKYSGTLSVLDPAWKIYRLEVIVSSYTTNSCPLFDGARYGNITYDGLAMPRSSAGAGRHLWVAANNPVLGRARTFLGEWSETQNIAPEANIAILGGRPDQSVLVLRGAEVELDAHGSSDANHDALTYAWRVTDSAGTPVEIHGTGSTVTFVPLSDGEYSLNLTVSDGIASTQLSQSVDVKWTSYRYIDRGNGTVLDTKTNLLWLKNAGCVALNLDLFWGVNATMAQERVAALSSGGCGLNDGSASGDWRLPLADEFRRIIVTPRFSQPPALLNARGDGQWSEEDAFIRVGKTNFNEAFIYWYWAVNPVSETDWYYVDFNYYEQGDWLRHTNKTDRNSVWPVRVFRPGEQQLSEP